MRIAEIIVGLLDINLIGVEENVEEPLRIHIECRGSQPLCPTCGGTVHQNGLRITELVDLPAFGRNVLIIWHKHRWRCALKECPQPPFSDSDPRIAPSRLRLSDRAGRWATRAVGLEHRSVSSVAKELGCDWHTINDAVIAYGRPLVDDSSRFGAVDALGLDEILFYREGKYHRQNWATTIVDVRNPTLLDVVPGRGGEHPKAWIADQGQEWCDGVRWGTLDLSGSYRSVFRTALPNTTLVADPFHVIKIANKRLDECRRRVQTEIFGSRGRAGDPLYRIRRLLTMAQERMTEHSKEKLVGLLRAGDPDDQVTTAWRAKEALRELYTIRDPSLAAEYADSLFLEFTNEEYPPEVQLLGRTLTSWKSEILAWHSSLVTNAPTEAMNNLAKLIKRIAFGMTNFYNFRIRALLTAGKVNWDLLATITPMPR